MKRKWLPKYEKQRCARIAIGRAIADKMPSVLPRRAVANMLGLSTTAVVHIECLALYKIKMRLQ